jgi:hypothetical protein
MDYGFADFTAETLPRVENFTAPAWRDLARLLGFLFICHP